MLKRSETRKLSHCNKSCDPSIYTSTGCAVELKLCNVRGTLGVVDSTGAFMPL